LPRLWLTSGPRKKPASRSDRPWLSAAKGVYRVASFAAAQQCGGDLRQASIDSLDRAF